jgi:hypothetical protein
VAQELIIDSKITPMEPVLNPQNNDVPTSFENTSEKSELMQFFESQVTDMYWAYKDLLKEIFAEDRDMGHA